jgi:glutaredoxin-related protein
MLSPEQELGALTAFMAALPQNVIPSNIDPTLPIDPQLVLDFDTRSPEAEDEIADIVVDAWMNNPVVLFTKVRYRMISHFGCRLTFFSQLRSAISREVKAILQDMDLKPPPTTFDVDQRGISGAVFLFSFLLANLFCIIPLADAEVLTPLLFRLTNSTELPILLIGGKAVGSMDTIRELHTSGTLRTLVARAGGVLDSSKRTRKGRR